MDNEDKKYFLLPLDIIDVDNVEGRKSLNKVMTMLNERFLLVNTVVYKTILLPSNGEEDCYKLKYERYNGIRQAVSKSPVLDITAAYSYEFRHRLHKLITSLPAVETKSTFNLTFANGSKIQDKPKMRRVMILLPRPFSTNNNIKIGDEVTCPVLNKIETKTKKAICPTIKLDPFTKISSLLMYKQPCTVVRIYKRSSYAIVKTPDGKVQLPLALLTTAMKLIPYM